MLSQRLKGQFKKWRTITASSSSSINSPEPFLACGELGKAVFNSGMLRWLQSDRQQYGRLISTSNMYSRRSCIARLSREVTELARKSFGHSRYMLRCCRMFPGILRGQNVYVMHASWLNIQNGTFPNMGTCPLFPWFLFGFLDKTCFYCYFNAFVILLDLMVGDLHYAWKIKLIRIQY